MPSPFIRLANFSLILLPLLFLATFYVQPLVHILTQSVDNSATAARLPAVASWVESGAAMGDEAVVALDADLQSLSDKELAELARQLNQDVSGFRSLLLKTGRSAKEKSIQTTAELLAIDKKWSDSRYWRALERASVSVTARHYQALVGYRLTDRGELAFRAEDTVYLKVLGRTFWISLQIAVLSALVGYPLAYAIANSSPLISRLILGCVILSFWTSVLVRTTAWVVLLQREGLLNDLLMLLRLIDEPIQLIFNRFGALVAMVHVLLPYAILPMLNNMKQVPRQQIEASRSLGAGPFKTFLLVYLPQTLRGVSVGAGIVFILSLGFYITPALVGGPADQMLSSFIADFMIKYLNWGMAAALSVALLASVVVCFGVAALMRQVARVRRGPAL